MEEGAFWIIKKEPGKILILKSDRRGSNPRSRLWQGRALPTTPLSHLFCFTRSCLPQRQDILYQTKFGLSNVFLKKLKNFKKLHNRKKCEGQRPILGDNSVVHVQDNIDLRSPMDRQYYNKYLPGNGQYYRLPSAQRLLNWIQTIQ